MRAALRVEMLVGYLSVEQMALLLVVYLAVMMVALMADLTADM